MERRNLPAVLGLTFAAPLPAVIPAMGARPPCAGFLSGGDEKGAESFVAAMLDGLLPRAIPSPKQ